MIPLIFFIFSILFSSNSYSSLTVSSETAPLRVDNDVMCLVNNACELYFKPIKDDQDKQLKNARNAWLDRLGKKQNEQNAASSVEKKASEGKSAAGDSDKSGFAFPKFDRTLSILNDHLSRKAALQESCYLYCSFVLKKHQNSQVITRSEVLANPLKNFWQIERVGIFIKLMNFHEYLVPKDIKSIETALNKTYADKMIQVDGRLKFVSMGEHNKNIQESIDALIKPLNQRHQKEFDLKLNEFYNSTELGEDFSFSKNSFVIDVFGICKEICINFLQKMCPDLKNETREAIFAISFQDNRLTSDDMPNAGAMQLFFESIIANQLLISGCCQYIDSVPGQQYPIDIRGALNKLIVDRLCNRYLSWFEHKKNIDSSKILEEIRLEAMTTVSSFYLTTIETSLQRAYPRMTINSRQNLSPLFQTALFSKQIGDVEISFANYPELDTTFQEALKDFDPYQQVNQASINQLVLNAYRMVKAGSIPTQGERFIKKYRQAIKKVFIILGIVATYLVIVRILRTINLL